MFNNPLRKYQIGGNISEDQAMQQVVEFISQVAKVSPEEVVTKLDQIKGDENAVKLLSEALELAKNNDERGFQAIQQIFNPQVTGKFAKGGKLHDFICKHAKGGYIAGCECGKNIIKAQNAVPKGIPNPYANYEMLRDTNYVNSNGDRIYEIYLKNNRGEGLKYSTLNGKDPIGIAGYISDDNKFINEGDGTVNLEALKQRLAEINKVKSEKDGGKFQEKNQKATFVRFNYPDGKYTPEEEEAYRRQATEAALDAMGANDGSAVYVTVTNELPPSSNTPTVFSTPAKNNPVILNLSKNSDETKRDFVNLLNNKLYGDKLVYSSFESPKHLKSENVVMAQEGGSMSKREALDKAMATHNYSDRATARFAYANAKNALRKEGYRGRALREQARRMIAGDTTGFKSEETNSVQNNDPFEAFKHGSSRTDYSDKLGRYDFVNGVNSKETKPIDNENLNLQNLIMANLIAQEPISVNNEIIGLPDMEEIPIPNFTVERGKYKETNTPENINEDFEQSVKNGWLNWYLGLSNSENIAVPTSDTVTDTYNYQYPSTDFLSTEPVQTLKWRPYWKQGGVLKGQNAIPEGMPTAYGYTSKPKKIDPKTRYSLWAQDRGGGGDVFDFGEVVTDPNTGLSYRDVRNTSWNSAFGKLQQDYYRKYVQDRAYKKALRSGINPDVYYTTQPSDSLVNAFNKNFGNWGSSIDGEWQYDGDPNIVKAYQNRLIY